MPADEADTTPATNLDHALTYARRGWRVVPIPPGEKFPRGITAWQTEGSTDEAKIAHWWTKAPDHGIGIVTGATSGLWVLDVDVAGDKVGDETLATHEHAYGELPPTYEVITGSGGRHYYFAWPDGQTITNSASGRLGPGLDVRGEGGFVVAPPSTHANGSRYEPEASAPDHVAPAPRWLLDMLREPERSAPTRAELAPTTAPTGDRPGDLFAAATTWAQILEPDGWTLHHVDRDGEEHWTRPGKERRDGTSATTGYKGSDVLKVFTSSHPQLAADETYTKLGYLAATRHGGDHAAAARALRADGHGPQTNVTEVASLGQPPTTRPSTIPIDLELAPQRPEPPLHALPPWVGDQVRNIARQIGCDPTIPAAFALGALSVASLGHVQVKVRSGETLRSTGLYIAVAGVPATGKSPALAMTFDALRDHELATIEQSKAEVAKAEASRAIAEKRAKEAIDNAARTGDADAERNAAQLGAVAATIEVPPGGELMTANITPEKLATLMRANAERIAIVSDESGVLNFDRYGDRRTGGANIDLHLQGFTGEPATIHRQSAPPVRLRHPLLAIVAGVQPKALHAAMSDDDFRTRGLGSRFLTVSTARLATNTDIDLDVWDHAIGDRYDERLLELARQWASWRSPAMLTIAPEGRRAYSAWSAEIRRQEGSGGRLEGESGWASKMRSSTLRIAAILHLAGGARHDDPIAEATIAAAIEWAEWFIAHHLCDSSDTPDQARRLASTIAKLAAHRDAEDGIVTRRMLARLASRGLRKPEEQAPPMALLVDRGWVELVPDTLGFAPSTEAAVAAATGFRLHPDAARQMATRATNVAVGGGSEADDHEEGEMSRVSRVSPYRGFETPLPSYGDDSEPTPGDTRDTRDNEAADGYEVGALFDRPGVLPPEPAS